MKKLFALCLITFALIAFAPPGQSNSPPIQDDFSYCIPSATFVPDMVAIELQTSDYSFSQIETGESEFAEVNEINVSHNYGLLCGYSRNAVLLSDFDYSTTTLHVNIWMRTCFNEMGVQNKTASYFIHYQPRDGLTQAAA